ncbi:peptidoglycan-binding domain-containing protein [Devriesea agamarum]|uniref:peptidoglycan-binding domain-containing protein n=1 Tax=Devriesea agamarum TaxID=472569 RepID=UPI00071D1CF2|nr:peptidoglycan-binding protein [Devriesea agamarum]
MSQLEDYIATLVRETGYREGRGNANKYSRELGFPADYWCYDFLSWGARKVGIPEANFPYSRYVPDAVTWGKRHGRFYQGASNVRRGDLLIVGKGMNHIELALSGVGSDGRIERIGGNTNDNGSANGDGVYHDRYRRASTLYGAVRPIYAGASTNGSSGGVLDVPKTQSALNELGYGNLAVDGVIGPATRAATTAFQHDMGIAADGIPGPDTRKYLEDAMSAIDEINRKLDELPNKVWRGPMIARRYEGGAEYPETTLGSMTDRIVRQQLLPLRGQIAGLSEAISQLINGQSIDMKAIEEAAERGAREGAAKVSAEEVANHLTVQVATE